MMTHSHFSDHASIPICGIGMDVRKEAVFRMAFKMYTKRRYHLLEAGETQAPAVFIVDVDGVDGAKSLAIAHRLREKHPEQRIILTSNGLADGGLADGGLADSVFPVLQKPVRMESLFSALEQMLLGRLADGSPADSSLADGTLASGAPAALKDGTGSGGAVSDPPVFSTATIIPPDTAPHGVIHSQEASRPQDRDPALRPAPLLRPDEIHYFNPQAGLLGLLRSIHRDQSPVAVMAIWQPGPADGENGLQPRAGVQPLPVGIPAGRQQTILRLDPANNQAIVLVDDATIQALAREEHPRLQMRAAPPDDAGIPGQETARRRTFQSLLWQVGAWSADGRVFQQLRVNTRVQLKQWPNLTRLAMLPNALRIAAFLARSPASPVLAVKMLHVAPADLFNFLAAADSLGLLRYDTAENPDNRIQPAFASAAGVQAPAGMAEIPATKRSFLGRILARIAGL